MTELAIAQVMRIARNAVGDSVLWTAEAKDALVQMAEKTISDAAERASERVLNAGRVKVQVEDLEGSGTPSRAPDDEPLDVAELRKEHTDYLVYVGMIEEALKRANQELKKHGVTPIIPRADLFPERVITVAGGKENRGTPVVHE